MESENADLLDASSSRVLEYYQKYSQDKKLATYFCGDVTIHEYENEKSLCSPMEDLPTVTITDVTGHEGEEIRVEEHINKSRPPLIGQDKYDHNVGLDDSENEIARATSPSSSVASNRKLEWDSGADIGYENYNKQNLLHKSLSLPTLTSSNKLELNEAFLRLSPEGKVTESSTQTQQKQSSSESSDSQIKPSDVPITSSSSDYGQNLAQVIQSSSSSSYASKPQDVISSTESECDSEVKNNVLDFLQKKVGLPIAASTPVYKLKEINLTVLPSTPVLTRDNKGGSDSGQECATNSNSNLTHSSSKTFASVISVVDNLKEIDNGFDVISSHKPSIGVKKRTYTDNKCKIHSLMNKRKNLEQLCITAPLIVECLESLVYGTKALDKVIQTMPISHVSVGIQTEAEHRSVFEEVCLKNSSTDRQSVIYFHHSDSDKEPSSRTLGTNTLSNATDQDISNCNSFEYLYGDQHDVNLKQVVSKLNVDQATPRIDRSTPDGVIKIANNLKRSQARSDLTVVSPDNVKATNLNQMNPPSHTNPLGDLIAHEQSNSSEMDVSKNIDLIKKLIKSKKYDKITKQYYIKKIVQTILNSNENTDTSNSNMTTEQVTDNDKIVATEQVNLVSDKSKSLSHISQQQNLQENLPWVPAQLQSKQLEVRTFTTEILPDTDACMPRYKSFQVKKNSVFTLPSCKDFKYYKSQSSSDQSISNEVNQNFEQHASSGPAQFSTGTSEQDSDYTNRINSYQNWKEAKTLSEQKFEQQQAVERTHQNCGDVESTNPSESDVLLNFAKKERENQINWINNEIVHLSKLKHLLQKKDYKVNVDMLTKPDITELNNIKKSTSVYVITTQKPGSPKNARKIVEQPISSQESTSSRKETITVKTALHEHQPIWYKNGRRYGRNLTYNSNAFPSTICKCSKSKANNEVCTDETCLHLKTSKSIKSSPQRTKKEARLSTLCKCTESKTNDLICSDETCPCTTESRIRKSSPRRTIESSRKEHFKESEKSNDVAGTTHLTLNSEFKQARLVSSELYSQGLHPYACIRRYVFEIPLSPVVHENKSPDTLKEGKTKHVKDKLADEYTSQHVMIEEKMHYPIKKSSAESTGKDQLNQGENNGIAGIDDEMTQRQPYTVNSYALTEIHGDQSKYLIEKDTENRTQGNIPYSYASLKINRDENARDLDEQDKKRGNIPPQASVLDTHRSDSGNLRKNRTKRTSVSYESSNEISVNDHPRTDTYHKYVQKEDLRNVNLQKTDADDKQIETDKITTSVTTKTKERGSRVKYSSGTSSSQDDEYTDDQKRRIYSEYKGSKSEKQKIVSSELDDQNRQTRGLPNKDSEGEDQKRRVGSEYKYDQKKGKESEYKDSRSVSQKKIIESEHKNSKSENQKRRTGLEYEDSNSEGSKRRIGFEYMYSKSNDEKMIGLDYKDGSNSEDHERRTESKYKSSTADQRKTLTDIRGREVSSNKGEQIDYGPDRPHENIEESKKEKIKRRGVINEQTDDIYLTTENKKINTEETRHDEKESNNKLTQTTLTRELENRNLSYASSSTSSSAQTESSTTDSSYTYICPCCKKNKSKASALVSNLRRDIQPLLCQPCYIQNQQSNWSNNYRHPGHVCNCYTVLKTETVQQIRRTVDELGDLEREQQYCSCSFVGKNKKVKYCAYCDCKKKSSGKKSVAYMLTFEQGSNESDEEIKRRTSLEEIKVKIPYPHKKNKDYENKKRKAKKDSHSKKRHRHQNHKKHKHPKILTLQEYLCLNRPNFIENAEQRRKCMIELSYMREQRCDKYKQLLALTTGLPPPKNDFKSKRIFTSRKMKEITAQNYKKLPEVQQKLKDSRDRQIKKANRLLADIFNKKLRENVLKGRHTLSTSASVIKLI